MKFKGKELHTGSDYYAAAMELMRREDLPECVCGAIALFIGGAEMRDRFCVARLKEIAAEPKYLRCLDTFSRDDLRTTMENILKSEDGEKRLMADGARIRRGMFGSYTPKPINHAAAMGFQRNRI